MLRAGQLDIALVHDTPPDTLAHQLLFEQPFGVAVRSGHPLAGRITCPVVHLDDVRVLAHRRDQVPTEHDRMIAATHQAGITPRWRSARFVENALICADASNADAVVLTEPSAARLLPAWPWSRLVEPEVALHTWGGPPAADPWRGGRGDGHDHQADRPRRPRRHRLTRPAGRNLLPRGQRRTTGAQPRPVGFPLDGIPAQSAARAPGIRATARSSSGVAAPKPKASR